MADKGVQVLDRAFDILEILSLERNGLGVTEIGNRLGLHKSTVHRILSAMAERGYIEKASEKGVYRIGLKLVEVSSIYLNNVELKTEAKPYLSELTLKMNQPSHLATLKGNDVVYIDKVEVVNSIRLYSQIGLRVPAYCSALGKSLLSGLLDMELEEKVSKMTFSAYTEHTITDRHELLRQVKQIREKGWALDDEEHEAGVRCIAAPVYDYRGKVIAAVSVSGPAGVISPGRDEEVAAMVKDIALKISKRLGYKK